MKCDLDATFALTTKERLLARAAKLRNTDHSKKVSEQGRKLLEMHRHDQQRLRKVYA